MKMNQKKFNKITEKLETIINKKVTEIYLT